MNYSPGKNFNRAIDYIQYACNSSSGLEFKYELRGGLHWFWRNNEQPWCVVAANDNERKRIVEKLRGRCNCCAKTAIKIVLRPEYR